jgi:hypothetical protein
MIAALWAAYRERARLESTISTLCSNPNTPHGRLFGIGTAISGLLLLISRRLHFAVKPNAAHLPVSESARKWLKWLKLLKVDVGDMSCIAIMVLALVHTVPAHQAQGGRSFQADVHKIAASFPFGLLPLTLMILKPHTVRRLLHARAGTHVMSFL